MANQQELSDYIKKVHIDLRLASREIGAKAAWEEHCKKDDVLKVFHCLLNLNYVYFTLLFFTFSFFRNMPKQCEIWLLFFGIKVLSKTLTE